MPLPLLLTMPVDKIPGSCSSSDDEPTAFKLNQPVQRQKQSKQKQDKKVDAAKLRKEDWLD